MTINPAERYVFAALADVLIPASDVMPSATAAGVAEALIDEVLGYRPDLAEDFSNALSAAGQREPEAGIDELAKNHPQSFGALTLLTVSAYVLSPKVRTALNYNAPPRAVNDDTDTYIDLLAAVVERGFHIR